MTIPDQFTTQEDYAVAWWASGVPNPNPGGGDYSGNGTIGPEDYLVWKVNFGTSNPGADGNGDGVVNAADYVVWRNLFESGGSGSELATAVPEPRSALLSAMAILAGIIAGERPSQGRGSATS